jgi:hypothetical protein
MATAVVVLVPQEPAATVLVAQGSREMATAMVAVVRVPLEQAVTVPAVPVSREMALVVLALLEPAATTMVVPGLREMALVALAQVSQGMAGMVLGRQEKVETGMVLVLTALPEKPQMVQAELASPERTVKALLVQALLEKVEMLRVAQVSRAAPTEKVTVPLVE